MRRFSIILMKAIRRIANPVVSWYRYNSFVSGLERLDGKIAVKGPVNLWNDHVSIGNGTNVYPNVTLWGPGKISIGSHVEVGLNTVIYASSQVVIGNFVNIAANCYIIDSNHGIQKALRIQEQVSTIKGPVIVEDDVWLGAGVKVLSGVHIGQGAVIGAGAVVNRDIPPYAIAVGIPAKVISYRE